MLEKNINEVSRQAREYYEKGLIALERNAPDQAIHFFTESLLQEPGFLKARQLLRVAQIKKFKSSGTISKIFGSVAGIAKAMSNLKKDPAKVMAMAEKALESNPFNLQALRALSEAAELLDLPQTAIFAYETAKEHQPNNISVLMELGRLHQACGHPEKAKTYYERVLHLQPSNTDAFKGLKDAAANEAMNTGNWEGDYRDNIKDLREAKNLENQQKIYKDEDVIQAQMAEIYALAEAEPNNVSHWKKLGDLALQMNHFDYAIQAYQHALQKTGGTDSVLEKIISDARVKQLNHAIREKEKELASDPNNETLIQEVEAFKQAQEKMVLEECEARARQYPNDLDIKFELGQIYFRNKQIDKAIPEFQRAAENAKNKISCINWLGQCFREKGMLDLAIQRFKSAATDAPLMNDLKKEILYNLGATYETMGKKAESIEQFKIIYDVDVNYRDVAKKIETYYQEQSGSA